MRIGLVGTRFAGLDGVTLESIKIAEVLKSLGHSVAWFGGRLDEEFVPGSEERAAYFDIPINKRINEQVFRHASCAPEVLEQIEEQAERLQRGLAKFVAEHRIDVVMPQNASAIPMQVPLGVAIARFVAQSGMPAIAHHHDFGWERSRFWPNPIGDLLLEAFPPSGPEFAHLVINSIARDELLRRRGIESRLLPNIMDFDTPPEPGRAARFKKVAGLGAGDLVLLQPTRMVPRKGIEDTFELARRLGDPSVKVVVTHPEPDEGEGYVAELVRTAEAMSVDFSVVPLGPDSEASLADAYAAADLVTYPSRIEGFGNALLEAFYYKRPVLVNRYPVYAADIGPCGVQAIEMDGRITHDVVSAAESWLADPNRWAAAVESNYEIGRTHFSYRVAARVLEEAITAGVR